MWPTCNGQVHDRPRNRFWLQPGKQVQELQQLAPGRNLLQLAHGLQVVQETAVVGEGLWAGVNLQQRVSVWDTAAYKPETATL